MIKFGSLEKIGIGQEHDYVFDNLKNNFKKKYGRLDVEERKLTNFKTINRKILAILLAATVLKRFLG